MEDQSRPPPVTGYPASGYHSTNPSAAANNNNPHPNGYPAAQSQSQSQSNTAYPYHAPPPQPPYYNPNPYNAQPYASPRVTFLRRVLAIIIGLFIITGVILFIIWLVLRPRLPEFRVDSLDVSNLNVSSSQITGDWDFRFAVRNPNKKMSIYYSRLDAFLYYKSSFLSETAIAPFNQGTKNQTVATASFASRGNYVEGWVVEGINGDRKSGIVGFDVRILARVSFSSGVWRARRRLLRVFCRNVKAKLSSLNATSGTLLTGNWECRVGM